MKTRSDLGAGPFALAIQTSLLLGTLGWFVVGWWLIENCSYTSACSETGCPPCATTELWITVGAIAQWVLSGLGVVGWVLGLVRRRSGKQRADLAVYGDALLAMSVLTMVGTTWLAYQSY